MPAFYNIESDTFNFLAMIKTIGYIVVFYFVIQILKYFFDPMFRQPKPQNKKSTQQKASEVGEFIDYEEVK